MLLVSVTAVIGQDVEEGVEEIVVVAVTVSVTVVMIQDVEVGEGTEEEVVGMMPTTVHCGISED